MRLQVLIQEIEVRSGDSPHTILTFSNKTGRLNSAPVWASDNHRIEHVTRGHVAEVTGIITTWRGRPQLQVHTLRQLDPRDILREELHPSIGNTAPWWQVLDFWRSTLVRPSLAGILSGFFDNSSFRRRFEQCPASLNAHHARLGGLLQHTCEVAQLTLAITALLPVADRDLALAGALLHDIGKLEAYCWEGLWDVTLEGRIIGHTVLGARMLTRACEPGGLGHPGDTAALEHLILSHHGRLEFGAPVPPLSIEAEILSHADLASARTSSFADAILNPDLFRPGDQFTAKPVWQLDSRHLWRGRSDSACYHQA